MTQFRFKTVVEHQKLLVTNIVRYYVLLLTKNLTRVHLLGAENKTKV